jgi:hypothetical protein
MLIQCGDRPDSYREPRRFDTIHCKPELARMGEDDRAVLPVKVLAQLPGRGRRPG